jgi:hypothetical protein
MFRDIDVIMKNIKLNEIDEDKKNARLVIITLTETENKDDVALFR